MQPGTTTQGPPVKRRRFHINCEDNTDKALDKWQKEGIITGDDAALIRHYLNEKSSQRHLTINTRNHIVYSLLDLRRFMGPYRKNTIDDIYAGIEALKNGMTRGTYSKGPKPYARNTITGYLGILKPFYFWLIEEGISSVPEKKLRAIRRPGWDLMTTTAGEILTDEEVKALILACENSRDRALIATFYDGGFRVSEIGALQWSQLLFDDYGVLVNVDNKTGKPRHVRLLMAAPYLATWKQDYPRDPTGDAKVFITIRKDPFTYDGIQRQIKRIAQRAGIKKHVSSHLFRHSRITHLIQKGVPESAIKMMMWGSITTDMFAAYAHLSNQDIDNAMLDAAGVKKKDDAEKKKVLEPRQCGRCYTLNSPTANFCGTCGQPLTKESARTQEELITFIDHHPELYNILKNIAR